MSYSFCHNKSSLLVLLVYGMHKRNIVNILLDHKKLKNNLFDIQLKILHSYKMGNMIDREII